MKFIGAKFASSLLLFSSLGSVRSFHLESNIRLVGSTALRKSVNLPHLRQNTISRRMSTISDISKEAAKQNFTWQQVMLRIKDPKLSLPFYQDLFGFKLVHFYNFPQWNFSLYFLAFIPDDELFDLIPGSPEAEKYLWSCKSKCHVPHITFLTTLLACTLHHYLPRL